MIQSQEIQANSNIDNTSDHHPTVTVAQPISAETAMVQHADHHRLLLDSDDNSSSVLTSSNGSDLMLTVSFGPASGAFGVVSSTSNPVAGSQSDVNAMNDNQCAVSDVDTVSNVDQTMTVSQPVTTCTVVTTVTPFNGTSILPEVVPNFDAAIAPDLPNSISGSPTNRRPSCRPPDEHHLLQLDEMMDLGNFENLSEGSGISSSRPVQFRFTSNNGIVNAATAAAPGPGPSGTQVMGGEGDDTDWSDDSREEHGPRQSNESESDGKTRISTTVTKQFVLERECSQALPLNLGGDETVAESDTVSDLGATSADTESSYFV